MQRRDAIKSAGALVVLSSDRWTKVLVRRQAHAFESFAEWPKRHPRNPFPTEKLQE